MTPERRATLAKGLAKNTLLPLLFEEFANDLREQWENSQPGEEAVREATWLQLKTLNDLRDSIYARLTEYGGDAGRNAGT